MRTDEGWGGPMALIIAWMLLGQPSWAAPEPPRADGDPPAAAEPAADQEDQGQAHQFSVGVMGSYLAALHGSEAHHLGGGGLLFEAALIPHWLELEYGVRVLTDGHSVAFPVDLLLELTFHASHAVVPFVGAGPTLIPSFVDELEAHAGIATAVGVCFWLWSWGGLFAEADYNLVFEDDLVHEIGASGGARYRF